MGKLQEALDKLKESGPRTAPSASTPGSGYASSERQSRHSIAFAQVLEIDWARLFEHGLLPEQAVASGISQQYRRAKRPLLRQIFGSYPIEVDETGRVLLVASALRGEGKSFTCLNLALAIAIEPELQVLLIDGDGPRQSMTAAFGLTGNTGLLDLAEDSTIDPASCIYSTSQDGLFVLPAGERRNNSPELLGSSRLQKIIEKIAKESGPCIVVIDSPPVMQANDARALSSVADHTLFVVKSGETNVNVVESALQSIGGNDNVYLLLNQTRSVSSSEYAYGHPGAYGSSADHTTAADD